MKIAILGGGFTGLVSAYYLNKKGHLVYIFEKEKNLGGLASGFKEKKFNWYLEKNVHHLFSNDKDILNFANEIGFKNIFFKKTRTGNLYNSNKINSRIIPLDNPQDLLIFPQLSFFDKIRTGLMILFFKITPFFKFYENITAKNFIIKMTGNRAWKILWQELFRKKFGKYAGNILLSFFWARIKKRTKKLGYIKGGFQELINYIEYKLLKSGVVIQKQSEIKKLNKINNGFLINKIKFDAVVCTLQTPIITRTISNIFPKKYSNRLKKIKYIHSMSVILITKKPLIENYYWINILDKSNKIVCAATHTNFIDKKHYNNKNITYLFDYLDKNDKRFSNNLDEVFDFYLTNLLKINFNAKQEIENHHTFFSSYTQPIFDKVFIKNKPEFITPVKNFFIANLDMTYPYDRGTNYAVKIGKKVTKYL